MSDEFDELARNMAQSVTRWRALRRVGTGLAGILLSAMIGSFAQPVRLPRAQEAPFTRITTGPVVTEIEYTWPCAWADYDNDGFLDLFVGNSYDARNSLFHNNGNGTFTKITDPAVGSIVTEFVNCHGCERLSQSAGTRSNLFVSNQDGGPNFLFHNNGDGTFTKITSGPIANDNHGRGCVWGDYDNDGWLDLFVNRGSPYGSGGPGENNALYHNNGDGTFTKLTEGSVVNDGGQGQSCAWGDYDNDGFLDLFVANGGFAVGVHKQANLLYCNNGNSNNWINFKLIGTHSNRAAIGAKVRVNARIGGRMLWQMREISGGGNAGGQNDLRANFGLGDARRIDTVRIEWPSGVVQELHDLSVKQFLTVTEPQ